ncbi:MAG: transposase [Myxococcales bacterium]|nr:transposase [Myxococcales bacterium]
MAPSARAARVGETRGSELAAISRRGSSWRCRALKVHIVSDFLARAWVIAEGARARRVAAGGDRRRRPPVRHPEPAQSILFGPPDGRHRGALGEQELPELCFDEPGLAACYAAAAQGIGVSGERAGKPLLRLVVPAELPERSRAADATDAPIAEVRGINLHAAQVIDGRDRRRVERLAKYITRPPIAQDRLERRQDGRLELIFKKVWRDGTRALVLEPTT